MPLSDIAVVDCGQVISGPLCSTFLADLGADVIKVEPLTGEAYRVKRRKYRGKNLNPPFELYNRNKRSLSLDLKSDEGTKVVHDLIKEIDVFVQNWPPGVAERLSVDYDTCRELNEELIYVHVSGYGETGPLADKPAMDTVIQHLSGFSNLLGYQDGPPLRSQSSLVDFFAGYNATISTLAALRHRDNGGGGQKIDISMLEAMMHNMDGAFEYYNNLGEIPSHGGKNAFFNPEMLYGAAEAKDGWVCVALLLYNDRIWRGFCELLNVPELFEDPKYQSDDGRMEDAGELSAMLEEWLSTKSVDEAIKMLNETGIPAERHQTIAEAAQMKQVEYRGIFTEIEHPQYGRFELTDTPLSLSKSPPSVDKHAPLLGEHSRDVLSEIGYSESEIDWLISNSIAQKSKE